MYGCEDVEGIFAAMAEAQRPRMVVRKRQRVREVKRDEIPRTQQTFPGQVERKLVVTVRNMMSKGDNEKEEAG